jgi:hypothetical protein
LTLRKPKEKGGAKKTAKKSQSRKDNSKEKEDRDDEGGTDSEAEEDNNQVSMGGRIYSAEYHCYFRAFHARYEVPPLRTLPEKLTAMTKVTSEGFNKEGSVDSNDPFITIPMPRYNAMLAVLRNTLYM